MQRTGIGAEAAPVGVGLLGDDFALFDEALEYFLNLKAVPPAGEPECEVLEIDEYSQGPLAVAGALVFHNKFGSDGRRASPRRVHPDAYHAGRRENDNGIATQNGDGPALLRATVLPNNLVSRKPHRAVGTRFRKGRP